MTSCSENKKSPSSENLSKQFVHHSQPYTAGFSLFWSISHTGIFFYYFRNVRS